MDRGDGGHVGSEALGEAPATLLFGSLAQRSFAELVAALGESAASGDLVVFSGATVRAVFFELGTVVYAVEGATRARLDDEAGGAPGAGAEAVDAAVLPLYELRDGTYAFDPRPCGVPSSLWAPRPTGELQLAGIRRMVDPAAVLRGLGPLERRVRARLDVARRMPLDPLERRAVAAAGGAPKSLRAIAAAVDAAGDFEVLRALYGLSRAGVLVPAEGPATARSLPPARGRARPPLDRDADAPFFLGPLGTDGPSEDALVERELELVVGGYGLPSPVSAGWSSRGTASPALGAPGRGPVSARPLPPAAVGGRRTSGLVRAVPRARRIVDGLRTLRGGSAATPLDAAIVALEELVERVPRRAEFHFLLAEALSSCPARRRLAEEHFKTALALAPTSAEIRYGLARYYRLVGETEAAVRWLRAALRADPGHVEARRLWASIRTEQGRARRNGSLLRRLLPGRPTPRSHAPGP